MAAQILTMEISSQGYIEFLIFKSFKGTNKIREHSGRWCQGLLAQEIGNNTKSKDIPSGMKMGLVQTRANVKGWMEGKKARLLEE